MQPSSLLGVLLDFFESLQAPDSDSRPADVRLAKFFRERRYLGSRDRRFVGDAAFALLRFSIRGDSRWRLWKARSGLEPPEDGRLTWLGPLLAIAQDGLFPWGAKLLAEAASTVAAARGGWTEVLARVREERFLSHDDWPEDPVEELAAECSLPDWMTRRLVEERGLDGARRLAASLLEPAPVDLRVNRNRIEREIVRKDLEDLLRVPVAFTPYSNSGLRLKSRVNLRQFMARHPGWVEIQDEGSQLAAAATGASADETIVDACAGGGGKTLAMADLVDGQAKFHVCDIDASKLAELDRRAQPLELRSLSYHQISTTGPLPPTLPKLADLVVVDTPCSGLGSLRRNPDLKMRYGPEDIEEFSRKQKGILARFAARVRPGGRLVYITCSILAQENEDVAEEFLRAHPDFEAALPDVSSSLPRDAVVKKSWLRIDPAVTHTDGFFVAVFRRRAGARVEEASS